LFEGDEDLLVRAGGTALRALREPVAKEEGGRKISEADNAGEAIPPFRCLMKQLR
jgi:hypothetical protein